MKKKKTYFDTSAALNGYSYNFYLDRLTELALSMFEYNDTPDNFDFRFLEQLLYEMEAPRFLKMMCWDISHYSLLQKVTWMYIGTLLAGVPLLTMVITGYLTRTLAS